ncbi:MAG: stealth conserved region 3 domain-containing protein [Smithella sp.]
MANKDFTEEEIDIVYTWVDGGDPLFISERKKFAGQSASRDARQASLDNHFRDNGELLYSLRSVEKFAPWVHRIHIVTNGQVPAWLNTDCERISLVAHEQIFSDPDRLPVFNSNAIESQLHRIPGLSRRFLYMNDDLFLCRPIYRSDYINNDAGQNFFFDSIPLHEDRHYGSVHDRAYAYTQMVAKQLQPDTTKRYLPSHCPQIYDREILFHLKDLFPDAFNETASHRFRDPKDLVLRILYSIYILETSEQNNGHKPITLQNYSDGYMFLMLDSHVLSSIRSLTAAYRLQPRFLCINDDIEESGKGGMVSLACRQFLKWLFPWTSEFEKGNSR